MIKNTVTELLTGKYVGAEFPSRNMKWVVDYQSKSYKIYSYTYNALITVTCLPRHKRTDISVNVIKKSRFSLE